MFPLSAKVHSISQSKHSIVTYFYILLKYSFDIQLILAKLSNLNLLLRINLFLFLKRFKILTLYFLVY